jgi:hypothetical protein
VSVTLGELLFLEMGDLESAMLPQIGGIFALFAGRATRNPRDPHPFYLAHTDNFAARLAVPDMHPLYASWIACAGDAGDIAVAIHLMPGADAAERHDVEEFLLQLFDPPCNRGGSGMFGRLRLRMRSFHGRRTLR